MENKKSIKCPRCKCRDTEYTNTSYIDLHPCEYDEVCINCGNIKNRFLYGNMVIENFKDMQKPPLGYRLKDKIKSIFRRKQKKYNKNNIDDIDYDQLPF